MARIIPFRALQYSADRVPIQDVVTQPYDKISTEMQQRYYDLHPNNLVRILRGKSEAGDDGDASVYTRAASYLAKWRDEGIIGQVPEPSLFAYFQRFETPGSGEVRTRKGLIGLCRLEDYANRVVFPHERTMTGPKQDRLELLRRTKTHFGQVFLMYSDPDRSVDRMLEQASTEAADTIVRDEYDVEHSLWRISDPATIEAIQGAMAEQSLLIADGHHRYETALAFRDEMRTENGSADAGGYEWLMTTMVNMESPGVAILPTHRVVSNVADYDPGGLVHRASEFFDVSETVDLRSLESELEASGDERPTIGVCGKGDDRFVLLKLKPGLDLPAILPGVSECEANLDVVVLHRLVLDKCIGISADDVRAGKYLSYVRGLDAAVERVREQDCQAAFLLNATRIDQVRDIAFGGDVLPQKSTDFYPKVLSGLTMYCMEP